MQITSGIINNGISYELRHYVHYGITDNVQKLE